MAKGIILLLLTIAIIILIKINTAVVPVEVKDPRTVKSQWIKDVFGQNVPDEVVKGIVFASEITGISSEMLSVLAFTESSFKKNATSSKGYKGIMQTPFTTGFVTVDILYGAEILKEKLKYSDGDVLKALALYKGGDNVLAHRQARYMLSLYRSLLIDADRK